MKETNKSILVDTVSYRNVAEITQASRAQKEIGSTFGKSGVAKTLAPR